MSRPRSRSSFRIAPAAAWVVDATGTLAIDARMGDAHWLHGATAAVWGWLSTGHSLSELVPLLAAYSGTDLVQADDRLGVILRSLDEAGLLDTDDPARG